MDFLRRVVDGGNIEHIDTFLVYYNGDNPTSQTHRYNELKSKGMIE